MNPMEMVVLIVAIVMIASVVKSRHHGRRRTLDSDPTQRVENLRLKDEVKELKERIKVLERITIEKENSLAAEIDQLRDR